MYTTEQFENAINSLNAGVKLLEVKILHGKVREFIGTQNGRRIVWDAWGNAFRGRSRAEELDVTKKLEGHVS